MNTFYYGVVEDRNDPEKMNRVRVRVVGIHSPNQADIATADLPWATVLMPVTASGTSGIGASPHGLVEGSWVCVTFTDTDLQQPLVMGSIAAISSAEQGDLVAGNNTEKGFQDPNGEYPLNDYKDRSDVNKHARGAPQNEETEYYEDNEKWPGGTETTNVVKLKTASMAEKDANGNVGTRTIDVPVRPAYEGEEFLDCPEQDSKTWDEPPTPYNPVYPYNKVYETESGHIIEIDDTAEAERIHIYHRTGTFFEIHPDGSVVTRIVGKNYEIVAGDNNVNIKGDANFTVNGSNNVFVEKNQTVTIQGDDSDGCPSSRIYIGGSQHIDINGSQKINIGGSAEGGRNTSIGGSDSTEVGLNTTLEVAGSRDQHIGRDSTDVVMGDSSNTVVGNKSDIVGGNKEETVIGNASVSTGGKQTIAISGDQEVSMGGNQVVSISGNQEVAVSGDQTMSVRGKQVLNIQGNQDTIIFGDQNMTVSGQQSIFAVGGQSIVVDGNQTISVTGLQIMNITGDQLINSSNTTINTSGQLIVNSSETVFNGDVKVTGTLVATGDVRAGIGPTGTSGLLTHIHSGVLSGPSATLPSVGP